MTTAEFKLLNRIRANTRIGHRCWIWTGAVDRYGYGRMTVGGGSRVPHRLLYQLLVGNISDDMQLDHLCRNKACVNPSHLEPVSALENTRRRVADRNGGRINSHCRNGHEFTPSNTYTDPRGRRNCRRCTADAQMRHKRRVRVVP